MPDPTYTPILTQIFQPMWDEIRPAVIDACANGIAISGVVIACLSGFNLFKTFLGEQRIDNTVDDLEQELIDNPDGDYFFGEKDDDDDWNGGYH